MSDMDEDSHAAMQFYTFSTSTLGYEEAPDLALWDGLELWDGAGS